MALALPCVLGGGHAVAGAVEETALRTGGVLSVLVRSEDVPRALLLNGARFAVHSQTHVASLAAVLGAMRAGCAERSLTRAASGEAEGGLGARGAALVLSALGRDGVFEAAGEGEGVVACFEAPQGKPPYAGPEELARALSAAADSGDLSQLGRFRYVYARAERDGRTASLELTSQGAFEVARMFPASGDAPGVEDAELPRPSGARRVLSVAHDVGQGARVASLTGYESPRAPSELRRSYAAELRARGFVVRELADRSTQGSAPNGAAPRPFVVRTARRTVIVSFSEQGRSDETWILLLPLP